MKPTPMILGAITLAIGAGSALGMSTPTDPLTRTSNTFDTIPQHAIERRSEEEARKMIAPRDQYPLETKDGVIEVSELVMHGRLREQTERRERMAAMFDAQLEAIEYESVVDYRSYQQARALDAQQPVVRVRHTRLDQVREEQRLTQAGYVPLEDGIFERRTASREIPARSVRSERFAQRDPIAEGDAQLIYVEQELAARN